MNNNTINIKKCSDFKVSGSGNATQWGSAQWIDIPQRHGMHDLRGTRVKALYSDNGIYFLYECQDRKITSTMVADGLNLWEEDVVELFLMPDPSRQEYFEYEISPLNYELPLYVVNNGGAVTRWQTFYCDDCIRIEHATSVQGGQKNSMAAIESWTAEFYIPFGMLNPMNNVPPAAGTQWRGNIYRVDYDNGQHSDWTWCPVNVSYHETDKFGIFQFE